MIVIYVCFKHMENKLIHAWLSWGGVSVAGFSNMEMLLFVLITY